MFTEGKSRSETVKKRCIYVYLPTEAMRDKWKERAVSEHLSLSRFVVEHVTQDVQRVEMSEDFGRTKYQLYAEIEEQKRTQERLLENNRFLETTVRRLEAEIQRYREEPFNKPAFQGTRQYPSDLIQLFSSAGRVLNVDDVLSELRIGKSDTVRVTGIMTMINNLVEYGVLINVEEGWKWFK